MIQTEVVVVVVGYRRPRHPSMSEYMQFFSRKKPDYWRNLWFQFLAELIIDSLFSDKILMDLIKKFSNLHHSKNRLVIQREREKIVS